MTNKILHFRHIAVMVLLVSAFPAALSAQNDSLNTKALLDQLDKDMVYVEGGKFLMGALANDKECYDDERLRHNVSVSPFHISKYEVTQELWQAVMDINPSIYQGDMRRPVESVSWEDCQEFIEKLNQLTGMKYRLPTEEEWEYAAKGGNKSKGCLYSGSNNIDEVAWYSGNSNNTTHAVGQKQPNELGLYDMSGNVYEWCQDWCVSYRQKLNDKNAASTSTSRICRGGNMTEDKRDCRVSMRRNEPPYNAMSSIGLRLAR